MSTARLGAALLLLALAGCEPQPAPGNTTARVVSVGPLRAAAGAAVALDYTVHDPEGDPVRLEVALCQPALGQSCTAQQGCTALRTSPLEVRGDADPTALHVHTLRWTPACEPAPPAPDAELTLCLRPEHGRALESEPFRLADLPGLAGAPAGDCP